MNLKTILLCTTLLVPAAFAAGPAREIAITANDSMQYNLKEIVAKPGETLRLKLSHTGKMPKAAMGHNWVLLHAVPDAEVTKIAMACTKNTPTYLPPDASVMIAHTKLIGGGESDTVEFTVPEKAGDYPYLCTFPGHFTMMKGKLIVK